MKMKFNRCFVTAALMFGLTGAGLAQLQLRVGRTGAGAIQGQVLRTVLRIARGFGPAARLDSAMAGAAGAGSDRPSGKHVLSV